MSPNDRPKEQSLADITISIIEIRFIGKLNAQIDRLGKYTNLMQHTVGKSDNI